jgi:AbrB family looped-hinge helix DNA binding protein
MQLAKLTEKGQITLSPETRRKLGVKGGDKVVLFEREDGYFIANANKLALQRAQEGFAGEAERLGLNTVDDVVRLVHDVRDGK